MPTSTTVAAFAALDSLLEDMDRLEAENTQLRKDLDCAKAQRDTANAQVSHYRTYYSRTGW